MRKVLLTALLAFACAPAPADALNRRDAAAAAHAYVQHFWHGLSYTAKCHPHHGWCRIRLGRRGCGCSFNEPAGLEFDISVQDTRRALIVRQEFFNDRFVLHWRPL